MINMATKEENRFEILGIANRIRETTKKYWFSYLLVVPTVFYLILLVWYPGIQGLYMSFFKWPLLGEPSYRGLDNYLYLFQWDVFRRSIFTTIIYGTQTIGHLVLGTVMALIVWKQRRFKAVSSLIFLIPILLPTIVTGTLFSHILQPDLGPFFKLLVSLGVLNQPIYWPNDGNLALIVITLIGVWTWSSFVFLLVYASLENIPSEHFEAAQLYGANTWNRFRYVTFPQIKSALLIALVLRIIRNLGKVGQPYQITRGGPGFDTSTLGLFVYRLAWERGDLGLAFAGSIVLGALTFVFIIGFLWKFESSSEEVPA